MWLPIMLDCNSFLYDTNIISFIFFDMKFGLNSKPETNRDNKENTGSSVNWITIVVSTHS